MVVKFRGFVQYYSSSFHSVHLYSFLSFPTDSFTWVEDYCLMFVPFPWEGPLYCYLVDIFFFFFFFL